MALQICLLIGKSLRTYAIYFLVIIFINFNFVRHKNWERFYWAPAVNTVVIVQKKNYIDITSITVFPPIFHKSNPVRLVGIKPGS